MVTYRKILMVTTVGFLMIATLSLVVEAQNRLTYPELNTALQVKLPNKSFKNKAELLNWLMLQVKSRKVDKPLTKDREDDLRQAGATDDLINAIKINSPALPKEDPIVDLGQLVGRATNLVKPDYTSEARQAGINGSVTLQLSLDEQGNVISTKTISGLPNGLTEQAIAAAKNSTFTPATLNGKPAKSIGTITYNFKVDKLDIASTLALGNDYLQKSNCGAAITEYTKIINVDAKQSKALLGRGICYVMNKNFELALEDLESATKLSPTDDQAFFYMAVAYDFRGNAQAAARDYEQSISINRQLETWPLIQCTYIDRREVPKDQLKEYGDGIVKACNTSLQTAPEFLSSLIYLKRGVGYRLKSDFERSIADFESARRVYPRFGAVQGQLQVTYNARGLAHFDKKEYKEAVGDITTAINLNPQNPTPFVNRCAIYVYGVKDYDSGISDCSAAIRLNDRATMAYNHRGYAYEMKKDLAHAITDYKKAAELDPQNNVVKENLLRAQNSGPKIKKN